MPLGDVAQGEAHGRLGHGEALDHIGDRLQLGPVRTQELEPCGRGEEEVAQLHHRAGVERGGAQHGLPPAGDRDGMRPGPRGAAGDDEAADGAEGGEGFASEAEGLDVEQVFAVNL